MILIPEFKAYVKTTEDKLPLVKFSKVVVEKDEVVKSLQQLKSTDNQIMLAVMPDARSNAKDEDSVRMNNATAFFFLEKTDYGAERYEKWLDIFERTQTSAVAFIRQLIRDSRGESGCGFVRELDPNNITIEPVSGMASCNGWVVECYFDMSF